MITPQIMRIVCNVDGGVDGGVDGRVDGGVDGDVDCDVDCVGWGNGTSEHTLTKSVLLITDF